MSSQHDVPITNGLPVHAQREPLAVIGIGCRFPGGIDSPTTCWNALLAGVNAIRDVPVDRWKHTLFHDTSPEKSGCIRNAKGGFIDKIDQFDGEFFGYFPTEAQRIDPQQRLLLEVTHEAMEDAGLRRDQLDGTRTSVFVGSFMYDFSVSRRRANLATRSTPMSRWEPPFLRWPTESLTISTSKVQVFRSIPLVRVHWSLSTWPAGASGPGTRTWRSLPAST